MQEKKKERLRWVCRIGILILALLPTGFLIRNCTQLRRATITLTPYDHSLNLDAEQARVFEEGSVDYRLYESLLGAMAETDETPSSVIAYQLAWQRNGDTEYAVFSIDTTDLSFWLHRSGQASRLCVRLPSLRAGADVLRPAFSRLRGEVGESEWKYETVGNASESADAPQPVSRDSIAALEAGVGLQEIRLRPEGGGERSFSSVSELGAACASYGPQKTLYLTAEFSITDSLHVVCSYCIILE